MEAGEERRNDEEAEEGFHNGEVPFGILISNLFKFPTTVTRERIVDGDGIVRNKSSGRILGIDIQKEKEGKERKRDVARDYLNCRA